jgi:hypothetical protein
MINSHNLGQRGTVRATGQGGTAEARPAAQVRPRPKKRDGALHARALPSAEDSRRSVSEEVEVRVERSFNEDALKELLRSVDQRCREMEELTEQLLQRAVARIAELEKPQTLSEATLAQIVEAAVARALRVPIL